MDVEKGIDRDFGLGVPQVLGALQKLERQGILSCVTGTKALVYYGVPKVPQVSNTCCPLAKDLH